MRRSVLSVLALFGVTALFVFAPPSSAEAEPCLNSGEKLIITPGEGVTLNGLIVTRGPSGFYETDAGLRFDLNTSKLEVLNPTCTGSAPSIQATTVDPFAGPDAGSVVLTLVTP